MSRRALELIFDPDESPFVWFLGAAMIILAFFGGIGLLSVMTPSLADECIAAGGTWHDTENTDYSGDKHILELEEICTPGSAR